MSEYQQILAELREIKTRLKYQNRLGLSGGRKYIAIEADKKSLWHYCDDDGTPVEATILTGYIKRIKRKEGDYPKLHIFIEADYDYVLVSGFSTHFSRQAMAAIASMSPQQLALPVIIKPDTGNDDGKTKGKKPVFCNIIQDGRTIRSGQFGTRDADELYQMAIAVLESGNTVNPSKGMASKPKPRQVATQATAKIPPPGLDDDASLPPIPPMKENEPVSASGGGAVETGVQVQSVDWKAFCKQHDILPEVLKALAQELGLPMGKLNPRQSAYLYHQAYARFVGVA